MIADARVLDLKFVPNDVVQRDAEINLLSSALRPAVEGEPSDSAFIYGSSGTGKTCIAHSTIEKLRQSTIDLNTQYVNCWEDHSHFSVLYSVLDGLDQTLDIHRQATPQAVLLEPLHEYNSPPYVVILDEADQLDTTDVLYEVLRTRNLSLILIANEEDALFSRFDDRLASRFHTTTRIKFEPYSVAALSEILSARARLGLYPDTVSNEQLEWVADAAAGDARVAIGVLRQAAQSAVTDGADQITDSHLRAAVPEAKAETKQKNISQLTRDQRILYHTIGEAGEITPGKLYEEYCSRCDDPKTKRMIRNYLQKLVLYNLFTAEGENRGRTYSVFKHPLATTRTH